MQIVRVERTKTVVVADEAGLRAAARSFEEHHWIKCEGFLAPALLDALHEHLAGSEFKELLHGEHGELGVEHCLQAGAAAVHLLEFLMNDRALFGVVSAVTGCDEIGCFHGRVYRFEPSNGHGDAWHDDVVDTRLVAMSVNLSAAPYEGAVLQIQDMRTGAIVEVPNSVPGDALLFRIHPDLKHRNSPLLGTRPKTAYAGWFRREPSFHELLFARARQSLISR